MSKYFKQLTALSVKPPNIDPPKLGTVPVNTTHPISSTVPVLKDELECKAHAPNTTEDITVPVSGTVPEPIRKPLRLVESVVAINSRQTGAVPDSGSVPSITSVPDNRFAPLTAKPRTRVFRATRVEHAHTPGERLVLQSLWTNATGNDKERTIRIGYDRLAALSGFNWKTARSCLRSLEDKLAIETLQPEDPNSRIGRLYRIHGFEAILERRRAAGLEWVQKGRGVEFVRTGTVPDIGSVPPTATAPDMGTGTPPVTGIATVPPSGAPLRSKKNEKESSSDVATLRSFVEQAIAPMDEDAARKLLETCRSRAGDQPITADDIVSVIRSKSAAARKADNPIGLLLTAVPKSFPLAIAKPEPRQQEDPVEDLEYWEQMLTNPDATVSQLNHARKLLGDRS